MDIHKLFNETLPFAMAQCPDKVKQIDGKFQFIITGDGGGEWYIDTSQSGPNCTWGNPGGADVTIAISSEDFQKYMQNPQVNGMQLFFAGKLKMTGNNALGMKMQKIFDLVS